MLLYELDVAMLLLLALRVVGVAVFKAPSCERLECFESRLSTTGDRKPNELLALEMRRSMEFKALAYH